MGICVPWITKSYLEMILETKGWVNGIRYYLSCLLNSLQLSGSVLHVTHCWFNNLPGVPRINTPPLTSNASSTSNQEQLIAAPKPLRITPNLVNRLEDLSQPWTRSPTKSKMEPVLATWHFISSDPPLAEGSVIGMYF